MQSFSSRFWSKVTKQTCWEWTNHKSTFGYGVFWLDGKNRYAHRVSWEIENGDIPVGMFVLHKCDNPPCVNPKHLFLGSRQDNEDDKYSKGRGIAGARNGRTTRTELDILAIRNCKELGVRQAAISDVYNVEKTTLSAIIRHKTWK